VDLILGIETSFDETALAAADMDGRIVYSKVFSQVELHAPFGGVVPELAARHHLTNLPVMFADFKASVDIRRLRFIGVTRGPGLPGCLLAGVNFSQGVGLALGIPVYGLSHLEGHLFSAFQPTPETLLDAERRAELFPFLGVIVSGGHTEMHEVAGLGDYRLLGRTLDDAAGEMLDKIAAYVGLGYPGGATIERLAAGVEGSQMPAEIAALDIPIPMVQDKTLRFSYSGLKTASVRAVKQAGLKSGDQALLPYFLARVQDAVIESIWVKVRRAVKRTTPRLVAISGGVACNEKLIATLSERLAKMGVELRYPPKELAVDNAEMMAFLTLLKVRAGVPAVPFDIDPNLGVRSEPESEGASR